MYFISHKKAELYPRPTHKILSTQNGRIVINCIEDVIIYATTQQIFFWRYEQEGRMTKYYLELGNLMKGEGRNSLAALCHRYALHEAWQNLITNTIHYNNRQEVIDPYEIYDMARLHLLDTCGSQRGLRLLKELHDKMREAAYLDRNMKREMERFDVENRIDSLIDDIEKDAYMANDNYYDQ